MRGAKLVGLITVPESGTLRDIIQAIEAGRIGIALVTDAAGRLLCAFTDGDVRRAMLAEYSLATPVRELLAWRGRQGPLRAVQAPASAPRRQLLDLMKSEVVRQVPLHDADGRVVGIATLADLALPEALAPRALIMAGGFGKRMGQVTQTTPKPMLPVRGMSLIERQVWHLRRHAVADIYVSVHHLAEKIMDHLGDGSRFDLNIHYVREDTPLGTAGAVGLLPQDDRPLLVMNGDLLTDFPLDVLAQFHRNAGAWLTMAVRTFEQQVAFGVVECDGLYVHRLQEKPTYRHLVNAGVYLLEPEACMTVTQGNRCDMTDVIANLIGERRRVTAWPILGQWLDVGRPDDYERANREAPLPEELMAAGAG